MFRAVDPAANVGGSFMGTIVKIAIVAALEKAVPSNARYVKLSETPARRAGRRRAC